MLLLQGLLFVIGLIFLRLSVISFIKTMKLLRVAETASAVVTDIVTTTEREEEIRTSEFKLFGKQGSSSIRRYGRYKHQAVYEFNDDRGIAVNFERTSRDKSHWKIGERVTVIYDPDNSADIKMFSFFDLFLRAVFFAIICFFFFYHRSGLSIVLHLRRKLKTCDHLALRVSPLAFLCFKIFLTQRVEKEERQRTQRIGGYPALTKCLSNPDSINCS